MTECDYALLIQVVNFQCQIVSRIYHVCFKSVDWLIFKDSVTNLNDCAIALKLHQRNACQRRQYKYCPFSNREMNISRCSPSLQRSSQTMLSSRKNLLVSFAKVSRMPRAKSGLQSPELTTRTPSKCGKAYTL